MNLMLIGLLTSCIEMNRSNPWLVWMEYVATEVCDGTVDANCNGVPDPEPKDCEGGCYEQSQDRFPLRSDEPKRRDDRKSEAFAIIPAAITLRQRAHSEKEKKQRGVAPANARKHGSHPDVRLTKHIGRSLNRYHSIGRR